MRVVPWFAALVAASLLAGPVASAQTAPCLSPPVEAPVVDPFRPPACEWCPGNRGIAYGARPGQPVRAMAAGQVTFSGLVAGTRYVVVQHADGLRATYGGLAATPLAVGDAVGTGALVGTAAGEVHVGLRRGETYVDPTPLLGRLVPRPRLVPTDGTAARAAPPARLDCTAARADAGGGRAPGAATLPLRGVPTAAWAAPHHTYPAVDVLVPTGTLVVAWRAGTVRHTHRDPSQPCGLGITVLDAADPGVTWTYCHLSRVEVAAGARLRVGQAVGRSGDTGRSGAPHLHLEIRVHGVRVCPQPALRALAAGRPSPDLARLPRRGCS